jgi:hypothetical protein
MAIKTLTILCIILIMLASPISAKLGSQTFSDINFNDDIITKSEIELSETKFSDPGILPDSPLYFLKKTKENVQLSFAFTDEEKSKVHLELSKKRLAEAKQLSEKNEDEEAKIAIEKHKEELEKSIEKTDDKLLEKEQKEIIDQGSIFLKYVIKEETSKITQQFKPVIELKPVETKELEEETKVEKPQAKQKSRKDSKEEIFTAPVPSEQTTTEEETASEEVEEEQKPSLNLIPSFNIAPQPYKKVE